MQPAGEDPRGPEPRGLLAIFAHPDDESFGVGGSMALIAERGVPVWLVCATNGDQGGRPGEDVEDHSMDPEIRRRELECACQALGVEPPIFLGYRDSGMEGWVAPEGALSRADPQEVIERLATEIRRLRPVSVVTFDPGGIYGHPDHVAVSAHATEAYRRTSGEPGGPRFLYHVAIPRSALDEMQRMMEEEAASSNEPAAQPSPDDLRQQEAFRRLARPDEDFTTLVDVRPVIERKVAALACHDSQMRGRAFGSDDREQAERNLGRETFIRVDPPPAPGARDDALEIAV